MGLNKTKLIADLTTYFSDVSPGSTPASKAIGLANILDDYVKTGKITVGTLASTGTGNLGAPVSSVNTSGGSIE